MKFIPQHDRLLVELIEVPFKTEAGLIMPGQAPGIPALGRILATGPLVPDTLSIAVGDVVAFAAHAGHSLSGPSRRQVLLPAKDVLATVEDLPEANKEEDLLAGFVLADN